MDAVIDWGAIAQNVGGFLFAAIFLGWILVRRENKMTELWERLFNQNFELMRNQQSQFTSALHDVTNTARAQQEKIARQMDLVVKNREGISSNQKTLGQIKDGIDEIIGFHKIESRLKELEDKVSNSKSKDGRGVYG